RRDERIHHVRRDALVRRPGAILGGEAGELLSIGRIGNGRELEGGILKLLERGALAQLVPDENDRGDPDDRDDGQRGEEPRAWQLRSEWDRVESHGKGKRRPDFGRLLQTIISYRPRVRAEAQASLQILCAEKIPSHPSAPNQAVRISPTSAAAHPLRIPSVG